MIICCEKLLPEIVRIYTNEDWTQIGDFDRLDYLLDDCIEKNEKIVVQVKAIISNVNSMESEQLKLMKEIEEEQEIMNKENT